MLFRCGHCKRLAPTWNDLAVKYAEKEEKDVVVAKVDCTIETALCSGIFRTSSLVAPTKIGIHWGPGIRTRTGTGTPLHDSLSVLTDPLY